MPSRRLDPLKRSNPTSYAGLIAQFASLGMKRQVQIQVTAAFALALPLLAAAAQKGISQAEVNFLRNAWHGHTAEIQMGQLAQEKGKSSFVINFGKMMKKDHGSALDELKERARAVGVDLPTKLGASHQAHYDMLASYSGDAFDRQYKAHMLKDHKKDYAAFSKMAQKAKNSNVKSYAMKYAPVVKMHLTALKTGQVGMKY